MTAKHHTRSPRHAALSQVYPSELDVRHLAMSGPHRRPRRSRTWRYLALVITACAYAVYRCLTTT